MKLSLAALVLLTQVFGSLLCCCTPQRVNSFLASVNGTNFISHPADVASHPPAKVRCGYSCSISPPITESQSPTQVVERFQSAPSQKSCACNRIMIPIIVPTTERPTDCLLLLFSFHDDVLWQFSHLHPSSFCTYEVPVPPPLAYLVKETQLYAHHVLRC